MQPDQPTVTIQREGTRVTARLSQFEESAVSVLHGAGFVPAAMVQEGFHRLPLAMTDAVEQRQTVTRAFDMLQAEGFGVSCDPDLLDTTLPPTAGHETSLGDRIGHLTRSIRAANHTSEAVATLNELIAPGDGVRERAIEALSATAEWWEGLGAPADPLYAARLPRIAGRMEVSALEIRSLRGTLADRHTGHPLHVRADRTSSEEDTAPRVAAALAVSPTARRASPAALPATPAVRPDVPSARPSSSPGR